jgi:hypothetical protein
MVYSIRAWIARPPAAWALTLVVAVAVAGVAGPAVAGPVIVAAIVYAAIKLSRPDKILRGQTLSPARQRRLAALAAGVMLGIAALFSGTASALKLAASLEARLRDRIEIADVQGATRAGSTFRECEQLVCAEATIFQIPTDHTLGIARLSGFALHDEAAYGWRGVAAHRPAPAPHAHP